jgi:hypothetical protein
MVRIIIASIIAAIVLFVWGFLSWSQLNLYAFAMPSLPPGNAAALVETMGTQLPYTGVYFVPHPPADMSDEAALENWKQRHRRGPIALIAFNKDGTEPMHPIMFVRGFAIYLIAAVFMCMMLAGAGGWARNFITRLVFVLFAAAFATFATRGVDWNWFYIPSDYTGALVIDLFVGWFLAGLVIAGIVKPKRPEPQPA